MPSPSPPSPPSSLLLKPLTSLKFLWKNVVSCFFSDLFTYPALIPLTIFNVGQGLCTSQALKYLFPSFQEMIQMTTPFFATLITVALNMSTFNGWAYLSLLPIIGGGIMCAFGEMNLHILGTMFGVCVCVQRSLRYYFFEKLMQQKLDTFALT